MRRIFMSICLVVLIGCSQIETGVSAANSETPAVASATSVNELLKAAKARVKLPGLGNFGGSRLSGPEGSRHAGSPR
jgi:hypothetical protein